MKETGAYAEMDESEVAGYVETEAKRFADEVLAEANKRKVFIDDVVKATDIVAKNGRLYLQGEYFGKEQGEEILEQIKITGKEIGEFTGDKKDYINKFKQWYKDNLANKSVNNPVLGEVKFYNSSAKETVNKNYKNIENLKFISGVYDLLKKSSDVKEESVKHPKPNVIKAWRVKGIINADGDVRNVEVVVLEDENHNRYYTFDPKNKISKEDTGDYNRSSLDMNILTQKIDDVNALKQEIKNLIDKSKENGTFKDNVKIGKVSNWLVDKAKENNLDITDYYHSVDVSAIKHIKNKHGDEKKENARGQIAITDKDIENISDIISKPDYIAFGGKNRQNNDVIIYAKKMNDGSVVFVEEIRTKRKTLSTNTMWKMKNDITSKSLLPIIKQHLRSDNVIISIISNIDRNVNTLKQESLDSIDLTISDDIKHKIDNLEKKRIENRLGENLQDRNFDSWVEKQEIKRKQDEIDALSLNGVKELSGVYDDLEKINADIEDGYNTIAGTSFERDTVFKDEMELEKFLKEELKKNVEPELDFLSSDDWENYRKKFSDVADRSLFFDTYQEIIKQIMENNGFYCDLSKSKISDSRYLEVYESEEALENGESPISKIRISDHLTHKFYGNNIILFTNKSIEDEIQKLITSFKEGRFGINETVLKQESLVNEKQELENDNIYYQTDVKGLKGKKTLTKGEFDTLTKSVKLYEKADYSTLQHELAHFWFDNNPRHHSCADRRGKGATTGRCCLVYCKVLSRRLPRNGFAIPGIQQSQGYVVALCIVKPAVLASPSPSFSCHQAWESNNHGTILSSRVL